MATEERVVGISYVAEAAIAQHLFVEMGTTARGVKVCDAAQRPIGACQNKATAAGQAVTVATSGVIKVCAGAAVAIGSPVGSDANGKGIVVVAGPLAFGVAITAATLADQIIEVQSL